jgi:dihydrolipoamide dehydrogenase
MDDKLKVAVIGGGSGGYPAAIRAARLGAEVTLIEKDSLGGVCLNRGCIPTKALLQSGEILKTIKDSGIFGIKCGDGKVDFRAVISHKNSVIQKLRQGVEGLLSAKKIRIIKGTAMLIDPSTIQILETEDKIKVDKIIIATGSRPTKLNINGFEGSDVLDSDKFLEMEDLPKSAVIIGGGAIGVEFAQILNRMGVEVTTLELMENLVPEADKEIAQALEKNIIEEGIKVFTKAEIKAIKHGKDLNTINFTVGDESKKCKAERVIVTVGRKPDLSHLNVDTIGLAQENNTIIVNDHMETNLPGVYAVGDVVGGIMFAHVATAEGECAAKNAIGQESTISYKAIPSCIYTSPEMASVGLTEEQAKVKFDIQVGRFPFYASGKALVLNQTYGMVKIIAERKYGEILGIHMIGPHVTDMIAEAVLGISMEMTVEELAHTVHPHPTLSEAVMEAALSLSGGAINMP